jgi:hypothetical protein
MYFIKREQEAKGFKDLQPTSRNTSTIHKVLCYLIPHLSRFHGIMQTLIICIELKKIKAVDARQGKLRRTHRLATTHKVCYIKISIHGIYTPYKVMFY